MNGNDMSNMVFGNITVVKTVGKNLVGHTLWECSCSCGNIFIGRSYDIKNGKTKSCGCSYGRSFKRINTLKSKVDIRFYRQWTALVERCTNRNNKKYPRYGGRGIQVEWRSFDEFKLDMFDLYLKHVDTFGLENTFIERMDNDKNYCKSNCTFATALEQVRNRSITKKITFEGKTMHVSEWAEKIKVPYKALYARLNTRGWSVDRALTTPLLLKISK